MCFSLPPYVYNLPLLTSPITEGVIFLSDLSEQENRCAGQKHIFHTTAVPTGKPWPPWDLWLFGSQTSVFSVSSGHRGGTAAMTSACSGIIRFLTNHTHKQGPARKNTSKLTGFILLGRMETFVKQGRTSVCQGCAVRKDRSWGKRQAWYLVRHMCRSLLSQMRRNPFNIGILLRLINYLTKQFIIRKHENSLVCSFLQRRYLPCCDWAITIFDSLDYLPRGQGVTSVLTERTQIQWSTIKKIRFTFGILRYVHCGWNICEILLKRRDRTQFAGPIQHQSCGY